MASNHTALDVARWMLDQLDKQNCLYQEDAVCEIEKRFGHKFVYDNENGNLSIDRSVLKEFRALTGDDVIWERGEKMWRRRCRTDQTGTRMQD